MRLILRYGTGVATTAVFLGIGLTLLGEPASQRIGAVLAGLGVLRGALVVKQFLSDRAADAEEA